MGERTYVFHLSNIIFELLILFRLLRAVFVYLLKSLTDIFLVLLATLVKIDARFVVGDPALAEVTELATLGLPIVCPGTTNSEFG